MFQALRRSKNFQILTGRLNDSLIRQTIRACNGSTVDLDHGSEGKKRLMKSLPTNAEQEAKPAVEPTLREQVKKKRVDQNPDLVNLETLPREELMSMIKRLNETNKHLVTIIQKGAEDEPTDTKKRKRKFFDSSGIYKRHILLRIFYLGWNFGGFVVQNNLANTIEQHLFTALTKSFLIESRKTSNYHLCGRTDKGVSAFEQVISLDVRSRIKPEDQLSRAGVEEEIKYCRILNSALPKQIRAITWRPLLSNDYSARFDCRGRTYKYFFHRCDLNVDVMQEACQHLIGTHDFRNFCKRDIKNGIVNHVRRLDSVEIKIAALNHEQLSEFDVFCLEIKGLSFLWHMIRYIVSILMMVGKCSESPDIVKKLLDVEVNERKPDYHMASQLPLNLFLCNFREEIPDENEDKDVEMLNKWVFDETTLKHLVAELQNEWSNESIKSTMLYEMLRVLRAEYTNLYPESNVPPIYKNSSWKNYSTILERQKSPTVEDRIQHFTKLLKNPERKD